MAFQPMKLTMTLLVALLLTTFCLMAVSRAGEPPGGEQQTGRLDRQVRIEMRYLVYLPKGYDSQASWPLLLFLHGAGERGDDLELVKTHGPPKLIAEGKDFPMIVVSPQCAAERWWEPVSLTALVDEIESKYKVDRERIYVTGLSMGGFGTWTLAAHAPHRFAAIAPVCGGGENYWAKTMTHLPVHAFHGALDPTVPVRRSEEMVAALKKAGGDPKLTIYPEAAHDSWTETYNNPKLYEWLLEQKRQPEPAAPAKRPRKARGKEKPAK